MERIRSELSKRKKILVLGILLFAITVICNLKEHMISVAYIDDLVMWDSVSNAGIWNTAWESGDKFRPISYGIMALVAKVSGYSPEITGGILLSLHGIITIVLFLMALRLSKIIWLVSA